MGFGVKRDVVFAAFRAKKIDFAAVPGEKDLFEVAAPNGEMWTEYLPLELKRREPNRLARLYGIPVQWFYTPLMIPGEEDKKTPS
jgi:hypothetical protein